jgi:hypothetical protein
MLVSRWITFRMRNVSDKRCRENQNTHFMFNNFFENPGIHDIMWKNMVQPDRPQTAIWRMRFACWVTKVTDTHSVILFPSYVIKSVWSLKIFYCNTYKNWEITQRLIYDLFSQAVRLKKAMSKRTFFSFNAAFVRNVRKSAFYLEYHFFQNNYV